ncbi:hypothetical protein MIMGU_mgv1a017807mg [Erythranthe guttata]|uniref:LOB domain-containing protein n=1 Tax=Erythranthe guttata TaxID=4155 RepID=A0A022R9Y4_ERYGU|nr:hypothetical protein MIMGU_mgv1a017807mg [Erythranthe guttata]
MANAGPSVYKACAACKHQRKKYDQNCTLAKYFPAEKSNDYENVYHLFGMQNTLKILKLVDEDERGTAIESIIMEVRMRLEYPVHDHFSVARKLSLEIRCMATFRWRESLVSRLKRRRKSMKLSARKFPYVKERIIGPARRPVEGSLINRSNILPTAHILCFCQLS